MDETRGVIQLRLHREAPGRPVPASVAAPPAEAAAWGPSVRTIALACLYAIPLVAAMAPVVDLDIWWHLRTGQWVVQHGCVPATDPFSRPGEGQPWVAYSWLFEVLVYEVYR